MKNYHIEVSYRVKLNPEAFNGAKLPVFREGLEAGEIGIITVVFKYETQPEKHRVELDILNYGETLRDSFLAVNPSVNYTKDPTGKEWKT